VAFRLSSEQLSSQRDYDFGMRAVNTIIQTAGNLRMNQPDIPGSPIVLVALKDVNLPKLLANDIQMFDDIIHDLFPGVEEKLLDYTKLKDMIATVAKERKLQMFAQFEQKMTQLRRTFSIRWGVMLVGTTKKSVTVTRFMMSAPDAPVYIPLFLSFSAHTSANQTQDIRDAKYERRLKGVYAPLDRKKAVIFFDDVNMPAKEEFGAQRPIELLRQWFGHRGRYDRRALEFHQSADSQLIWTCGHPGGGCQELMVRFPRHFNIYNFTEM
jgi:hypothetical protein